jgi:4-coumarate--CoA ligase
MDLLIYIVGVPDETAGELPKAFVVLKPEQVGTTEGSMVEWIHPKVPPYKLLRGGIEFVHEIPKSPSGILFAFVFLSI